MESLMMEHNGHVIEAKGDIKFTANGYELLLHYTAEDNEDVTVSILKEEDAFLIRETSASRQLYLMLSSEEEEGYLKTVYGLILFHTQLLEDKTDDEHFSLRYRMKHDDEWEEKQFIVTKKGKA